MTDSRKIEFRSLLHNKQHLQEQKSLFFAKRWPAAVLRGVKSFKTWAVLGSRLVKIGNTSERFPHFFWKILEFSLQFWWRIPTKRICQKMCIIHQKLNGTSQNPDLTRSCNRAITYSGFFGVPSVDPVRDFYTSGQLLIFHQPRFL